MHIYYYDNERELIMNKLIASVVLLSTVAIADTVSDTVRITGTIEKSGCALNGLSYRAMDAPQASGAFQKIGTISVDSECFGNNVVNLYPEQADSEVEVRFVKTIEQTEISAASPVTYSGEFNTEFDIDVLINLDSGDYDTTVRMVIETL